MFNKEQAKLIDAKSSLYRSGLRYYIFKNDKATAISLQDAEKLMGETKDEQVKRQDIKPSEDTK